MTTPNAYGIFQEFPPAPAGPFQVDRHYLLYASKGAMRLTADGSTWSLPPARAALITADKEITVTLPQQMTICSALFSPDHFTPPPAILTIFDMSPLAKELVLECGAYGPETGPHDGHVQSLFAALASVAWRLARTPSPASMPTGQSEPVTRALAFTEKALSDDPTFEQVAQNVAMTPRSLARRFSQELGMTWRQTLRKMRMIRAIEALAATDTSVTTVASRSGIIRYRHSMPRSGILPAKRQASIAAVSNPRHKNGRARRHGHLLDFTQND